MRTATSNQARQMKAIRVEAGISFDQHSRRPIPSHTFLASSWTRRRQSSVPLLPCSTHRFSISRLTLYRLTSRLLVSSPCVLSFGNDDFPQRKHNKLKHVAALSSRLHHLRSARPLALSIQVNVKVHPKTEATSSRGERSLFISVRR